MSPSDQVELTKQTQQYVTTAQQNLHRADGHELNTSQHDMVDKIRGFLEQAQDAIRTSDWSRAKKPIAEGLSSLHRTGQDALVRHHSSRIIGKIAP